MPLYWTKEFQSFKGVYTFKKIRKNATFLALLGTSLGIYRQIVAQILESSRQAHVMTCGLTLRLGLYKLNKRGMKNWRSPPQSFSTITLFQPYFENSTRYGHRYNARRIGLGSRTRSIDFEWPNLEWPLSLARFQGHDITECQITRQVALLLQRGRAMLCIRQ